MGKKILIISEFIAPVQSIASIRWTKYAKYLAKQCGCEITVLTNKKCFDKSRADMRPYQYDSTLAGDTAWFNVEYIPLTLAQRLSNMLFSAGYSVLHRMQSSSITNASQDVDRLKNPVKPSKIIGRNLACNPMVFLTSHDIPDKMYEFVDQLCGRALISAGKHIKLNFAEFDYVISSYSPRWTHDLALEIKKKNDGMIWVADFRDPLFYSKRTNTLKRRKLTKRYVNNADIVLAVSRGCADNLLLNDSIARLIAYNGFDPDDIDDIELSSSDRFTLVYTGTLHSEKDAKRDLAPLYRAIDELISEGTINPKRILCIYAGGSSHLFQKYISSFPQIPFLDKGLLPRGEALQLQQRASALVVANWNTQLTKGVLSGKVFEYLGKQIPLIGLVSGNVPYSALRALIKECEAGCCYEEADPITYSEMKNYIASLYCAWEKTGSTSRSERSLTLSSRYAYPALAQKLYDALECVLEGRGTRNVR